MCEFLVLLHMIEMVCYTCFLGFVRGSVRPHKDMPKPFQFVRMPGMQQGAAAVWPCTPCCVRQIRKYGCRNNLSHTL